MSFFLDLTVRILRYSFFVYQKGEIKIKKKIIEQEKWNNLLEYSMKLALINKLLESKMLSEQEYSLIKSKIKLEHKII